MKYRLFLGVASFFLLSLTTVGSVFADCEISSFDENTRNLTICVGKFPTKEALRATSGTINCLGNSNLPDGSFCRDITNPTFSLSTTPDDKILQDGSGLYFTCPTATGINRAIGKLNVSFSGGTTCTTASKNVKPSDWNALTEGAPWNTGTNDPNKNKGAGDATCIDGKSINTALGCISTDFASGGFVKDLLKISVGLGGGFALLLILYGVFIITSSAGIPEKLQQGQEIITSAVVGLIMIIMSIVLLNLIGVKILQIPGL